MQSTPLALRKGVGQERQHDKVFSKRVLIFSFFTFEFFIFRLTFFPCAMSHQCWKRDNNSDTGQPSHLYQYLESDDSRSLQALDMLLFVTQVAPSGVPAGRVAAGVSTSGLSQPGVGLAKQASSFHCNYYSGQHVRLTAHLEAVEDFFFSFPFFFLHGFCRVVLSDVLHVRIGLGVLTEATGKNHAPQGWAGGEGGYETGCFFLIARPQNRG